MTAPEDFLRPRNEHAAAVRERLARFRRRARFYLFLRGALTILLALTAAAGASFVVDRLLRLGTTARLVILVLGAIFLLRLLWRHLVVPLSGDWNDLNLGAAIDMGPGAAVETPPTSLRNEEEAGFITQRLSTLIQLADRAEGAGLRSDESPELIREALRRSREELAEHPIEERLDGLGASRRAGWILLLLLVPVLLFSFSDSARLWAKRWFLLSEDRWPQETYLVVRGAEDGAMIVPRMESTELAVFAREGSVVPKRVEIEYEVDGGARVSEVMSRFAENDFRFRLPGAREEIRVWLKGNDDRRGPILLEARARPRIESFVLAARLAQDDSLETFRFERQDRDLAFRRDTQMILDVRASEALSELTLEGETGGIEIAERGEAERRLSWTHQGRRVLTLELRSRATGLESRPVSLDLGLREDAAPRMTLAIEGVRDRVSPRATVPTGVLARDDYGLRDVSLDLSLALPGEEAGPPTSLLLAEFEKAKEERSFERERAVELGELGAKVGQRLELVALGRDHGHLGSQTGKSRTRILRVVAPEDLFREIALRLQRARSRFRIAKNEADATESMLRREEDIMERGDELLRRHRILERQVWSADRTLRASVRELSLNRLIEQEAEAILERAVLEPLRRLQERQLPGHRLGLEKVVRADEDAPEREVLLAGQEAIGRSMQRVLDGLKQWDSFIDLVNQLDEVIKVQDGVRDQTVEAKETKENRDGN